MDFQDHLISEITKMDRKNSTKRGYNPNALGIYFRAAEGVTDAKSFSEAFTATRDNHGIAKRLGLNLDVASGEWIMGT